MTSFYFIYCTTFNERGYLFLYCSYHQKYRLQAHKKLASELGLGPSASKLLQTSHLAAKLNGYLVGVGGAKQFDEEAKELGLNERQIEYVMKHVKENEGGGLTC
jgi:peptide-methionine (S)-S-oxide reductase